MSKMVNLKRPKSDRKGDGAEVAAYPGDDGVSVHLDHHHLTKLGVGGALKSGDQVEFVGRGHVEHSSTTTDKEGERHSATIRLHKGALEHEPAKDEERDELKGELAKNYDAADKK